MPYPTASFAKTAFPMFDMMLRMQEIGMNAISMYQPVVDAIARPASGSQRPSGFSRPAGRMTNVAEGQDEQVIPLGEEVLNVGTRMVQGKTTRVRRFVVEAPVQQEVTLHTETVVVEHRKPVGVTNEGILTEVSVEMSDSSEVPMVSKSVRLVEEVLLRKEVTARVETIRDTVRRDKLEIDQPANLPVVFDAAKAESRKQDDKRRDESRSAEASSEKKPSMMAVAAENKAGQHAASDQKRN